MYPVPSAAQRQRLFELLGIIVVSVASGIYIFDAPLRDYYARKQHEVKEPDMLGKKEDKKNGDTRKVE